MSEGDKVTFTSIPGAYKTGENVYVKYEIDVNFETNTRDWVGVFCVGWSSNRDYYTFEWIQNSGKTTEGSKSSAVCQVKFSGSRLPPEDGHFYQFCYVTRNGVVKGASRPFQFTKKITGDCISDLDDLIEINEEDSLLFLRTRHETQLSELQNKVEQLTTVNETTEASFITVKSDRDDLKEKCRNALVQLNISQHEVDNLKDTVVAKEEQLERMKEKLQTNEEQFGASQKEVGLLQMTVESKEEEIQALKKDFTGKSEEVEALCQNLMKQKMDREKQIRELSDELTLLLNETKVLRDNEQSLRDKCNQLEQENREILEKIELTESRLKYKESEVINLKEEFEVAKAQMSSLEEEMNEMATVIEKEQEEKKKLVEIARLKEQEANIAQENLCEVLGNVNEPRDLLDRQGSTENVDKSALEALQLAYSDVEKKCNHERKSALRLKAKVAEMEERIKQCLQQYETMAQDNVELKKELKRGRTPSIGERSGGGSEAGLLLLQREYERLELELQEFQLKHDQRIDEKNVHIQQLEKELGDRTQEIDGRHIQEEAMKKSIESLKAQNDQLSSANAELNKQLEKERKNRHHYHHRHNDALVTPTAPLNPGYQPSDRSPLYPPILQQPNNTHTRVHSNAHRPSSNGKVCPICDACYPQSMAIKDFERHVNSHF